MSQCFKKEKNEGKKTPSNDKGYFNPFFFASAAFQGVLIISMKLGVRVGRRVKLVSCVVVVVVIYLF